MLPDNIRKEHLGKAHLMALAAMAGIKIEFSTDDFGIDGYFSKVCLYKRKGKARYLDIGGGIFFQLKSSSRWQKKENSLIYDLEVKSYNDLITLRKEGPFLCILILLCLPSKEENWVQVTKDSMILKENCYWYCVDKNKLSKNKETERIKIPLSQILTPTSLQQLLEPKFLRDILEGHI